MDPILIYQLIYLSMTAEGREERLFGSGREKAFDAFLQSTPGNRFPELWFEIPLLGDPWFDLHVLTAAKDLPKDRILPQERCAGYADTFQWFSKQTNVRQLALSWDLNTGMEPEAAIQLLLSGPDPEAACGFLEAAGRPQASPSYRTFLERLPKEWFACYLGVFPSRPGHHLRVECIPEAEQQKRYVKDISVLGKQLSGLGLEQTEESILPVCRMLADTPFQLEFQFDLNENGEAGRTFGASLRFSIGRDTEEWQAYGDQPATEELMTKLEQMGLVDDRWKELAKVTFARKLKLSEMECRFFAAPAFVKLRWRDGRLLDAKAYIIAGTL